MATLALLGVPRSMCSRVRGLVGALLAPGQGVAQHVTLAVVRFSRRVVSPPNDPAEVQRLRDQVRHLTIALHQYRDQSAQRLAGSESPPGPATPALLRPALRPARVIGRDAAALLRQERLLESGTTGGVRLGALVLGPTTIDVGERAGVQRGEVVLLGRSVVGRIAETGPLTSSLQLITDPGFRKLARVGRQRGGAYEDGPQGILVGEGNGRCRLTRVAGGEDIRPGDWVMTTGYRPLTPHGLAYGRIVRCTHQEAHLYWDIVVEPTAGLERLDRVFVLDATINPEWLAGATQETGP